MKCSGWIGELIRDHDNTIFAITGGLGSGKTTGTAIAFFYRVLQNPTVKQFWVVAPTYSKVDDTMLPTCAFVLANWFNMQNEKDYTIKRTKPACLTIHSTGQEIYFHSGDRPENMVSATIGGFWISEPGIQSRLVLEKCIDRARDAKMDRIFGYVEGTPEGSNWYMDEFNFMGIDHERKYRRFIVETYDNIQNLADGYIERLKRTYSYSPQKVLSYIYGLFSNFTTGNVFAQYAESRNVALEDYQLDPYRPIDICFDFNATPLCWSAWQCLPEFRDGQRRMTDVCLFESDLNCSNLFDAATAVATALLMISPQTKNSQLRIFGDRTGHGASHKVRGSDFENLQKHLKELFPNVVIMAQKEIVPIRASVDVCNRLFLYERIKINSACKNVRHSFSACTWKPGTNDIAKPQGETHTHHSDGARYRIWQLYKDFDVEDMQSTKEKVTSKGMNLA